MEAKLLFERDDISMKIGIEEETNEAVFTLEQERGEGLSMFFSLQAIEEMDDFLYKIRDALKKLMKEED